MHTTQTRIAAPAPAANHVPAHTDSTCARRGDGAPRPDLHLFVHKGLRAFLSDTLNRCGRRDASDESDVAETLAQVRALVELCRAHLNKEEDSRHRAIEARRPRAARQTIDACAGHMHVEETANDAVLRATHSDEELLALQKQPAGSIPPAEMQRFPRWMVPAMAPAGRARLLGDIRQHAPGEVVAMTLMGVKPHLTERGWNKLTAARARMSPTERPR